MADEERAIQRNAVELDRARQFHLNVLVFPDDIELTNEIFSPHSVEGAISPKEFPVQWDFTMSTGHVVHQTEAIITWKVSVVPVDERIVQRENIPRNTAANRLAAMMGEVNMDDGNGGEAGRR